MAKKMKKYMVVEAGACFKGTEITPKGTKVSLTDEKAAAMIGKVRLLDDYEADNKSDADLKKENVALNEQLGKLTEQLTSTKADDKLVKANKKLVKDNKALTEQLGKLTEQLTTPPDST